MPPPAVAKRHASVDPIGAASSPLPPEQWHYLAEGVLRDAGGSLPSVRKVRKR